MNVKLSSQQTRQNSVIKILPGLQGFGEGRGWDLGRGGTLSLMNLKPVEALALSPLPRAGGGPLSLASCSQDRCPGSRWLPTPPAPPLQLCTGMLTGGEGSRGGRLSSWQMDYGKGAAPVMGEGSGKDKTEAKDML